MPVISGSFGLILGVSATKSTGASQSFTAAHDHLPSRPLSTTFVHILRL